MKLLLLHPLPLDGSIFSNELRALADQSVSPTLYDAGDDLVAWARRALDAVGDGPLVVVGNSIGGSCAIEVARLAPTKVKALVIIGSKPGHDPDPAFRDEALDVIECEGFRAAWEKYWLPLFGPDVQSDVVERGWRAASAQGGESIATGVRAFHSRPDRSAFLASWPGPVVVVSGEHDRRFERDRRLARRLPNATFHSIAGVGHYVPLEAPDLLATITSDVIARTRPRSSGC